MVTMFMLLDIVVGQSEVSYDTLEMVVQIQVCSVEFGAYDSEGMNQAQYFINNYIYIQQQMIRLMFILTFVVWQSTKFVVSYCCNLFSNIDVKTGCHGYIMLLDIWFCNYHYSSQLFLIIELLSLKASMLHSIIITGIHFTIIQHPYVWANINIFIDLFCLV